MPKLVVLDRDAEIDPLDVLLTGTCDGIGGALVRRGEPEAGSVLVSAVERAAHLRVIRLAGVESETSLEFAAPHRLLIPFRPRLAHVPEPQRGALLGIFGMISTAAQNRFVVGLAVLTDAAAGQPLLVAVDEAQWLDNQSAEILASVARRLRTERIALVISVHEPSTRDLDGLPELALSAPDESSAPPSNLADQLLDGCAARLAEGYQAASPILREAVAGLLAAGRPNWTDHLACWRRAPGPPGNCWTARHSTTSRDDRPRNRANSSNTPGTAGKPRSGWQSRSGPSSSTCRIRPRPRSWPAPTCSTASGCATNAGDARRHLSTAGELFTGMGMTAFARRANMEKHATGEHAGTGQLTPRETQIVRLVIKDSTKRQIAARLFISPNTVEYHCTRSSEKSASARAPNSCEPSSITQMRKAHHDSAHCSRSRALAHAAQLGALEGALRGARARGSGAGLAAHGE